VIGRRSSSPNVVAARSAGRHGHAGLDKRPVDIDLARLADREYPSEPVDPALLTRDLLRPNEVEESFCRCRRAVPDLGARVTGLAFHRRVDAVQHDPFAGEAQHCQSDNLGLASIDRDFIGSCLRPETRDRNRCRHKESLPHHHRK
jgi:hypothetical protein